MCGITGIVSLTSDQSVLEGITAATKALEKRGPDAEGIFSESNIAMGHRRLSIIDTQKAANQPMLDQR